MKKFSELPIQEQFDWLRQRHPNCKVRVEETFWLTTLVVVWEENWRVLDTFPHYTVAILDEKLL